MRLVVTALGMGVLFITCVAAQERTGGPVPMRSERRADIPALGLPVHQSGVVLKTDTTRHAIQIQTKSGRIIGFALDPKCRMKADKKQFGKKELTLPEIEAGYQVELTIRQVDMCVIEMKVKKPKEAPPNSDGS